MQFIPKGILINLPEYFGFDLSNTFAGQAKLISYLLERHRLAENLCDQSK
jgi:hypothetical protein